jgi:negative regulator of flagellin synthesis FlgM
MTHKIEGAPAAARTGDVARTVVPPRAGAARDEPVAAAAAADSVRLTGEAEGLQALERQLGAAPAGIDLARVNALRAALADGSYRVDAQQVADRMLRLERDLGG